jgi:hypothetical protein
MREIVAIKEWLRNRLGSEVPLLKGKSFLSAG